MAGEVKGAKLKQKCILRCYASMDDLLNINCNEVISHVKM